MRKLKRASREHSRKQRVEPGEVSSAPRADPRPGGRIRTDALHKATTSLARRYATIVTEDLNVGGMVKNRRLARAVSDQGFGHGPPDARLQDGMERRQPRGY